MCRQRGAARSHNFLSNSHLSKAFILFIASSFASGCAIGNRHNYRDVIASLPTSTGQNLAVETHDRRPYILSNDKEPNFVGLQRGGYGNPFNVLNQHKEFLSTSISTAVCNSLSAAGAQCRIVETVPTERPEQVVQKITQTNDSVGLLFTLNEWKADTMMNTALHYDVTITVLSPNGNKIAARTIKGVDDLRGSFWNAPAYAKKSVPQAFRDKLELLFTNEDIRGALQGPTTTGVANNTACTVSQILKMKEIGLTDSQIKKTCK